MGFDNHIGAVQAHEAEAHTCMGSHGKTLSVGRGKPDKASKPPRRDMRKHKPLAKCGKFCYNIYILSPFSWGIMKPIP